jgi:predicted transposase/invertase (TIGR01784 family)
MVLANLLKYFVPEFDGMDVATIARDCILPEGMSERIQTDSTDYSVNDTHFDFVIHVRLPNSIDDQDLLVINLEFQNKLNPHCKIIKRGIYYSSCLLVDEKGKLFQDSHYENLKKVCSLWVCPNSPEKNANTVCHYDISEHPDGWTAAESAARKEHDLLEMRIIYLNGAKQPIPGTGFHLLHTLFNSSLTPQERADILEQYYSIVFNKEEPEMYDIIKEWNDQARKKGRKEGRKEGREAVYRDAVKRMLDNGVSPENIRVFLGLTHKQLNAFSSNTNAQ